VRKFVHKNSSSFKFLNQLKCSYSRIEYGNFNEGHFIKVAVDDVALYMLITSLLMPKSSQMNTVILMASSWQLQQLSAMLSVMQVIHMLYKPAIITYSKFMQFAIFT
jgi:hypothetical protein